MNAFPPTFKKPLCFRAQLETRTNTHKHKVIQIKGDIAKYQNNSKYLASPIKPITLGSKTFQSITLIPERTAPKPKIQILSSIIIPPNNSTALTESNSNGIQTNQIDKSVAIQISSTEASSKPNSNITSSYVPITDSNVTAPKDKIGAKDFTLLFQDLELSDSDDELTVQSNIHNSNSVVKKVNNLSTKIQRNQNVITERAIQNHNLSIQKPFMWPRMQTPPQPKYDEVFARFNPGVSQFQSNNSVSQNEKRLNAPHHQSATTIINNYYYGSSRQPKFKETPTTEEFTSFSRGKQRRITRQLKRQNQYKR